MLVVVVLTGVGVLKRVDSRPTRLPRNSSLTTVEDRRPKERRKGCQRFGHLAHNTREEARASNERRARQRGSRQKHRAQGTPKSTSRDDDGPLGPSLARSRSARCRPGARRRRGDPFAPLGILRRHSPTKVSSTLSALLWQVALALVPSALLSPRLPLSGPAFLCYTRNLNGAVRRRRPPEPEHHFSHNIPDWKYPNGKFSIEAASLF